MVIQICTAVVLTLSLISCWTPAKHVVRQYVRPYVLSAVEQGMSTVRWAQNAQHPALTALFNTAAHTVSVSFYAFFLPSLLWVCG